MKHIKIKSGLILVSFLIGMLATGCTEKETYMDAGVIDLNDRITSVDKQVTQPGDVVTITGTGLDEVYKVLLNTDNVPVPFTATATQLKVTIPATSPLGDVITVSLLFSGKGIAQIPLRIISPPVIFAIVPEAAYEGDVISLYGKELHLSKVVKINDVDVSSTMVIESDKILTVVAPTGFAGGNVTIATESGGVSTGPYPMILGTEIMINNFDGITNYAAESFMSSNGNLDNDVEEMGEFPRSKFWTFTIKDNNTSWGGNLDLYTTGMPDTFTDLTKIRLCIDIQLTKAMSVNVMIARGSDVWGKTLSLAQGWNSVVLPFNDMGSGYGSTFPPEMPLPLFEDISGIKVQPPAQAASGNFGEKISVDNIKFIIVD
ncbi:MAG: IPT/TIG domain-containing protein [Bacteroidales bacterium]|nr:IPT/TIG domain-containing protein [Bacteroidales bacterium]MDT8374997.1 IPT/TIG domain-containing protein [Bacteroidales bacterium]